MVLILENKNKGYYAKANYDADQKIFVVLKGSKVSDDVAQSEKFRGHKSIISRREIYVKNGIVKENVTFKSSSTAANFITGRSTNGLITWKDENGTKLKDLLSEV